MDFTPTDPAHLEVEAAALAAFNARAAVYQQGTEAVKQAAASQQSTEAGANFHSLGKAMQEITFDPSHPTGIDVPITPPKILKPRFRRRGTGSYSDSGTNDHLQEFMRDGDVSQAASVTDTAIRVRTRHVEMSPQDAPDMEIVAPIQIKFMEMLFELSGQLSMRQMRTIVNFLADLSYTMVNGFEEMGCESVGDYEGKAEVEKQAREQAREQARAQAEREETFGFSDDEKTYEGSEGEGAMAMSGGMRSQSSQENDEDLDEEDPGNWV